MSFDVTEINRVRAAYQADKATVAFRISDCVLPVACGTICDRHLRYTYCTANAYAYNANTHLLVPCLTGAGVTTLCVGCMDVANAANHFYFRCGVCCLWTVPAGVTKARFEVWGPGAGTPSGCCCGGSFGFGQTGAYGSVILNVQAGWQYTLCAGCAICCYAARGAVSDAGGPSFVSGCGLTCFSALGGNASLTCRFVETSPHSGCFPCAIMYPDHYCKNVSVGCFLCVCGDYAYCHTAISASSFACGRKTEWTGFRGTGYTPMRGTLCYCHNLAVDSNTMIFGVAGVWSTFRIGDASGSDPGYSIHPPIPGFPEACCCVTWTTGASVNAFANSAWCSWCTSGGNTALIKLPYPSAGGWISRVAGGQNSFCGDSGRGGLVRITYC